MLIIAGAVIIAGAIVWAAWTVAREIASARQAAADGRTLQILAMFAPAIAAADADPRALLVWHPLAGAARQLFPAEFEAIDRAAGFRFPFSRERIQAAHARWTADWLAWERTHDAEFKLKASSMEEEIAVSGGTPLLRSRLEAVEREKLDRYQRRYEEYVRVGKAIQALGV